MKLTLCERCAPFIPLVVRDESGAEKYRFEEASRFTWKMTDANGEKLLSLYQEWDRGGLKPLRPCHGALNGVKFTAQWEAPYPPMFDLGDFGWKAEGDLMSRDFVLTRQGRKAAQLKRHWLRLGSQYTLEIADAADEQEALAVALCIHLMRKHK